MAEKTINLRGLKCPLPTLRVRKALTGLKPGDPGRPLVEIKKPFWRLGSATASAQ